MRGGQRGGQRDGHHIRAVVDHFLPDAREPASDEPSRRGAGACYRFAVAAPERGLLAAFACAQLARASLPGGGGPSPVRVRIEEWHRQPWSAVALLGGSDRGHLLSLFEPRAATTAGAGRRIDGIEFGSPGGDAEPGEPGVTAVTWLNLGRLSAAALAAIEAARACRGAAGSAPPLDGLVWCFTAAERRLMEAAYRLGRIVAALAPAQLKLLRFPEAWAEARAVTAAGPDPLWAAAAATEAPVELVPLDGGPEWLEDATVEAAAARDRQFRRLVTSLELGAASLRRAGARGAAAPETARGAAAPETARRIVT